MKPTAIITHSKAEFIQSSPRVACTAYVLGVCIIVPTLLRVHHQSELQNDVMSMRNGDTMNDPNLRPTNRFKVGSIAPYPDVSPGTAPRKARCRLAKGTDSGP